MTFEVVDCPGCGQRVTPRPDGSCPSCGRPASSAEAAGEGVPTDPTEADAYAGFRESLVPAGTPEPLVELRRIEASVLADPQSSRAIESPMVLPELADEIEQRLVPSIARLEAGLESIPQGNADKLGEFLVARIGAWQALAAALRSGDVRDFRGYEERWAESELLAVGLIESTSVARDATAKQNLEMRFSEALRTFTPWVVVTPTLIVVNLVIFALTSFFGGDLFGADGQFLRDWGANYAWDTRSGQWWRVITSAFLHFGLVHVAFNMLVLADVGRLLERLIGNIGFAVVYFATAAVAGLCSVAFNEGAVCAGASGAVFGVAGALLGFVLRRHDTVPKEVISSLGGRLGTFVVINLMFGFTVPGIDNAAHVGGLVSGFACGLVLSQPLDVGTLGRRPLRNLAAVVAAVACGAVAISLMPAESINVDEEFETFAENEATALRVTQGWITRLDRGQADPRDAADALEEKVVTVWAGEIERMERVREVRGIRTEFVALFVDYTRARHDGTEALVRFLRSDDPDDLAEWTRHQEEADRLVSRMQEMAKE